MPKKFRDMDSDDLRNTMREIFCEYYSEHYSYDESAKYLGTYRQKIYDLVSQGKITSCKKRGHKQKFITK